MHISFHTRKWLLFIVLLLLFSGCGGSGGSSPSELSENFNLMLSQNYDIMRDGDINAEVVFVVEKDNAIVIEYNGKGNLNYNYFYNIIGSNYRAWLEKDGNIVSNIVEYTPTLNDVSYELTLGSNYKITRTGDIFDNLFWIVDNEGLIIEEKSAYNFITYTYTNNLPGETYRIWLEYETENEEGFLVASNIIEYTIPSDLPYDYSLTVNNRSYPRKVDTFFS